MEHVYWDGEKITGITRDYIQGKVLDYNDGYSSSDFRVEWEGSIPEGDELNWLVYDNVVYRNDSAEYFALVAEEERKINYDIYQDKVSKRLASTTAMLITFLQDKFTLSKSETAFIDGMTTMADVKNAFKALLSMTPAQIQIAEDFHTDYQAWAALQE